MNSKIVFAALSLALVLNGASAAMAGGKKELVDPRHSTISMAKKSPGVLQNWCDIDPKCNGWGEYMKGIQAGKKFKG